MRKYNETLEHSAKKRDKDRRYWDDAGPAQNAKRRQLRAISPEVQRARARERYENNRDVILAQTRASSARRKERSPEIVREQARMRMRKSRSSEKGRIHSRISTRVRQSAKGCKYRRGWETILGYTVDDLIARLRTTIPHGYVWDDFISAYLQIDHIRPVASFSFSSVDDPEFRECWSLSNLQLLPALENNRKNCRVDYVSATAA